MPDPTPRIGAVPVQLVPGIPAAVIVDIDGTIAKCGDRDIYDNDRAIDDTPHLDVINHTRVIALDEDAEVILMTARSERFRDVTARWLSMHDIRYKTLLMRPDGDEREDTFVKYDLFNQHIRGVYNVVACFDDRDQVVAMWRSIGLRCYQVQEAGY